MARRILTDFVIDKIAAVDRPCQEHARVTIMKRAPEVTKTAVAKLMEEITKKWSDAARAASAEARRNHKKAAKLGWKFNGSEYERPRRLDEHPYGGPSASGPKVYASTAEAALSWDSDIGARTASHVAKLKIDALKVLVNKAKDRLGHGSEKRGETHRIMRPIKSEGKWHYQSQKIGSDKINSHGPFETKTDAMTHRDMNIVRMESGQSLKLRPSGFGPKTQSHPRRWDGS